MKQKRRGFLFSALTAVTVLFGGTWLFRKSIIRKMGSANFDTSLLTKAPGIGDNICVATPELTEGPFFFPAPDRKNITEGKEGVPMNLSLQIVNYPECIPISNAVVEIWHCDAEGIYSGYPEEISHDVWKGALFLVRNRDKTYPELHVKPTTETRFLRGSQVSNEDGMVTFETIFPGWYDGRVPHIHAKIITEDNQVLTSQFFIEEDLCNDIYTTVAPYTKWGKCNLPMSKDGVLGRSDSASNLILNISKEGNGLKAGGRIGLQLA